MTDNDGRHDFDFLFGQWNIAHRVMTNDGWNEFETEHTANRFFGGLGNIEFLIGVQPNGKKFEGMALRLFDPANQLWRIWWASSSYPGQLGPPVEGRFSDGVGTFYGHEVTGGQLAKIRLTWKDITPTSATWSQAYSHDEGETWGPENWLMYFTRRG